MTRLRLACAVLALAALVGIDARSAPPALFVPPVGAGSEPAAPWRVALLPRQKPPATRFDVVELDGARVLRVTSPRSYGNLVHAFEPPMPSPRSLRWSWRVDRAPAGDLRTKEGDDVALKVCALFDWPRERLPFGERVKIATASALAGEALPTATICWVADERLPAGTWLPNAYTARIRMLVVRGRDAPPRRWSEHERDPRADFREAFADEWRDGDEMPALRAVLVGGDTDNTAAEGLGYLRTIDLR